MPVTKQKDLLCKVACKAFEDATVSSLGSTFHIIITFHLKQKFNRDPYEVLIDDPKTFYEGLKEVLGAGAEAVINLVGTLITIKYNVNCTVEEFTSLFTKDGMSSTEKLSEIFGSIIAQEEQKLRAR